MRQSGAMRIAIMSVNEARLSPSRRQNLPAFRVVVDAPAWRDRVAAGHHLKAKCPKGSGKARAAGLASPRIGLPWPALSHSSGRGTGP